MKKFSLPIILFVLICSCKEIKKENKDTAEVVGDTQKSEVKLYTFDGGTVIVNQLELFSQDTTYRGQSKEFSDAFYVIRHPKGDLMWDAGLPESLVGLPEPYTDESGAFTVSRKDSVLNQLKQIGMTPEDFEYISLSHTHFDHSGHANVFRNATWLVQETEYDFVTSEETQQSNVAVYNAIKELENIEKVQGDFDVFGDGTVVLKYTPGHTPGHQALYLDLVNHGALLLSGDLYHFSDNREFRRIPIFNYDVAETRKSMSAFEAFAEEKKATVYLQHSTEDFEKMPKAPNYLN